jgi:hypothetical protein
MDETKAKSSIPLFNVYTINIIKDFKKGVENNVKNEQLIGKV